MWIEELTLENIKGFEKISLKFSDKKDPVRWITLLGENGGGKSTVLQSLGLLLAGPENVNKLLPVPYGWVRKEGVPGKLTIRIHQGENDPGTYGEKKESKSFGYTYFVTGSQQTSVRNKVYTEPIILENPERRLTWLKQNALTSKGKGWFAAGYGAFRRLTRESRVIIPTITSQERHNNFTTQFKEDEALSSFEQWMVYLDYRIAKGENDSKSKARRQLDIAVEAINKILPEGVRYDSVAEDGKILFDVNGIKVSTIGLSDGYRSILALIGDLIWRLLDHFPNSNDPLKEEGVVLIDELDIHLHPVWQRNIAMLLREQFPKIQFIVATHSPMITAGAGPDALTYRFVFDGNKTQVNEVKELAFLSVDKILASPAFGLVSPFSPQTEMQIQTYLYLKKKVKLTSKEKNELQATLPFVEKAYGALPEIDPLQSKMENYLKNILK
ncbi:ATPase [Sphingobacteriales bacterium UPWRP_1]|nr:ATPase [Sphingobacteriales bacterium TSM_CSM]PSJ73704.1 ATPase [Sphingobacteriales bacterium UPWRP_1]